MEFKNDCLKELRPGEIWVGNTNVSNGLALPEYLGIMKTARLGNQAYDIKGEIIEKYDMRPLIIHKSEALLYDKIMMQLMKYARNS